MSLSPQHASWPRWLPGAVLLVAILWLLRDTAAAMVSIWLRSETFTHALLVPPIAVWLAWQRRAELQAAGMQAVPWLLLPIAATCFVWLLGDLAAVGVVSQFALVTLIALSVPAVFGWAVARILAFPLAFLYFAVPFGEFTQPRLMEWTADFTVLALQATGIPVYREGQQFVIPSGSWSVVEACSGVRYLIASFVVGTLFAYLNYRSMRRRLAFMLVSLIVPVLANWLRAYMIVMIGHLSGNTLAVGVDHLIYGWVFFGVVIGLMFLIGMRWAEPELPPAAAAAGAHLPPGRSQGGWKAATGVAALVLGVQAWSWQLDHPAELPRPQLALPESPAGWARSAEPLPWHPAFRNPSASAAQAYDRDGRRVWVWVGYYRQQHAERKLVSSVNALVDDTQAWTQAAAGGRPAAAGLPAFRTATLRQARAALDAALAPRLRVWQLYWVGGRWTASDARAKLHQAVDRLLGRGDEGAVLLLATPLNEGSNPGPDATLEQFARDGLAALDAALAQARDTR